MNTFLCRIARIVSILFLLLLVWSGTALAQGKKKTETTQSLIQHAWTYYWIGMVEKGDLKSYDTGLDYVEKATKTLKKDKSLTNSKRQTLQVNIAQIKEALTQQRDLAKITLRGNFPLTAFLGKSIFIDATSLGTYEIIDEPYDAAVTQMAEILRDEIIETWGIALQTNVLVISKPANRTFENKVTFLVERAPKINIVPLGTVQSRVDEASYKALLDGRLDDVQGNLATTLGAERLLIIQVTEVDIVDEVYFYEFRATMQHASTQPSSKTVLVKRGIIRDRRPRHIPFTITFIAMCLFGIGLIIVQTREDLELWEAIGLGVLGFLVGTISPQVLMTFLDTIKPQEEELLKLAFWWPIVAGLVVCIGPSIVFMTLANRIGGGVSLLRKALEYGPIMACGIGVGSGAYLARGAVIYTAEWGGVLAWIGLLGTIGAARLVSGIRLQRMASPYHTMIALVAVVLFPLGFFAASIPATLSFGVVLLLATGRLGKKPGEESQTDVAEDLPLELGSDALDTLVKRARRPQFQSFPPFEKAITSLKQACDENMQLQHTVWIVLQGQKGSGKTATSTAIVSELGPSSIVLHGICSPPSNEDLEGDGDGHEAMPYEAFVQAFGDAGTFGFEAQDNDVFAELEDTVMDALPIVSMLLPPSDDGGGGRAVSDRGEIYARIERELIKKTRKNTRNVVLWLDDIQWLDNASQGLLDHLMDRFKDASHTIVIVLCGRDLPVNSPMSERNRRALRAQMISVELGAPERMSMLTESIGLSDTAARLLDGAVTDGEGEANLAWLLTLVEAVAREGMVKLEDDVYHLTVSDSEDLPIPESFKNMVGQTFKGLPRNDQYLLKVATCLGSSFSVEVIHRVMRRARLEILDDLDRLASDTHLVEDHLATDDIFRFVSAQRYVALRDYLHLQDLHPRMQAPQMLRDLHYHVALEMEALWRENSANVADVAHHYYNAGRRDLNKAVLYCERAAGSALDVFAYDNAEFQLKRAQVCAEMILKSVAREDERRKAQHKLAQIELELKRLPFEKAHVLGLSDLTSELVDVAQRLFEPVKADNAPIDPQLLISMTRACYDGRRFDLALEMANHLVVLGQEVVDEDLEASAQRAILHIEGRHFIGLSLSPRDDAPLRLQHLLQAMEAATTLAQDIERAGSRAPESLRINVQALKGRLFNSLGEQYSNQVTYDFIQARASFHRSVEIKKALTPQDKPGLARAYGGLGRLYLFATSHEEGQDEASYLERARDYLEEDIHLCQDYGDVAGECQMHSHLGQCALRQGDAKRAVHHYECSLELATASINKAFGYVGLIDALESLGDGDARLKWMKTIIDFVIEGGVPPFLSSKFLGILQSPHTNPDVLDRFDDALAKLKPKPTPQTSRESE